MRLFLLSASLLTLSACASAPEPSDPEAFSRTAAISMTQELSRDALFGRMPGTEGSVKAQDMIIARLAALGVTPLGEAGYRTAFTYTDEDDGAAKPGVNLLGLIEGNSRSGLTLVVTAHYDHVGVQDGQIFNGADDNASGVGALMAVAEYFSVAPPKHNVIIAALDAEEFGFGGAKAFLAEPPIAGDLIAANLNLDMVARGDNGLLWASGTSHWPQMIPVVEDVAETAPVELRMGFDTGDGRDDWTMLADHAVFFEAGIPHLYLGVEDHPDYHTPRDDFARIDQDWFARSIETIVMVADAMDEELDEIAGE